MDHPWDWQFIANFSRSTSNKVETLNVNRTAQSKTNKYAKKVTFNLLTYGAFRLRYGFYYNAIMELANATDL